jgi:hypothetical protein
MVEDQGNNTSAPVEIDFGEQQTNSEELYRGKIINLFKPGNLDGQLNDAEEIVKGLIVEDNPLNPFMIFASELEEGRKKVEVGKITIALEDAGKDPVDPKRAVKNGIRLHRAIAEQIALVDTSRGEELHNLGVLPGMVDEVDPELRTVFSEALSTNDRTKLAAIGFTFPVSYGHMARAEGEQVVVQAGKAGNIEEGRKYLLRMPGYKKGSDGKVSYDPAWRNQPPLVVIGT